MRALRTLGIQAAIVLILLEVGLRIYNPLPFRVRGDRIVLPIGQRYTFHHEHPIKLDAVIHHTKNSIGFRGPDPPADFRRRLTLVTIGGSTTECLFISDGNTWTDVLARRLAVNWPSIWVNNAGLDGQSTYGHLVLLRDFVVSVRPSMAVFLIGVNDVGLASSNSYDATLAPSPSTWLALRTFLTARLATLQLAENLARAARAHEEGFGHSELDLASLPLLKDDAVVEAAAIAKFEPPLRGYRERLIAIIDICRRNGIDPVFMTQPALFGDAIDPATGLDLAHVQVRGDSNGKLSWRVQEMYNDVTRRIASDRGVLLIDAAHELPKDSRLFYDFVHFTNAGAARLGDIAAAHLEPYLREHGR